jgi:hypothetical protein
MILTLSGTMAGLAAINNEILRARFVARQARRMYGDQSKNGELLG